MASDQEIASCVESLLRSTSPGDRSAASAAAVLRQVEAKLGLDLSHKASFIRDQIDLLLGHHHALQPPPPPVPSPQQPLAAAPPASLQQQQPPVAFPPPQAMAFYPPPPLAYRYSTLPLPGLPGYHVQQVLAPPPPPAAAAAQGAAFSAAGEGDASKESTSTAVKRKRGGPGGLNKVCGVSPELQVIVGETAMSRTQIVKQLWAYIRKNNLQDPDDKRKIICNDELRVVFGTNSTDMFKMNKLLAKHIIPLDTRALALEAKRLKEAAAAAEAKRDCSQPFVVISDALARFIGTEEREMPKEDALKHVWDYIKAQQLEDVVNRLIICDVKLQELFGCESILVSRLSDMLMHHFVKASS